MVNASDLLTALGPLVRVLEADLREQAEVLRQPLEAEHEAARRVGLTSSSYEAWRDDRIAESAAWWVVGTVVVRFCEDNGLLGDRWFLGGPTGRASEAVDAQRAHLAAHPGHAELDWLTAAFAAVAAGVGGRSIFPLSDDPAKPLAPSNDGARRLLSFWRGHGDAGLRVFDFRSDNLNTTFLVSLYEGISEIFRKKYVLLRTPEFVVNFLLDRTLGSRISESGPYGLRVADPVCGAGSFLLAAFERLVREYDTPTTRTRSWDDVRSILSSLYGVDRCAFATAITRFRLLVAAMRCTETRKIAEVPPLKLMVRTGDSLLAGGTPRRSGLLEESEASTSSELFLTPGSFDVVVGNPPYTIVKNAVESNLYRSLYPDVCDHRYTLAVPFTQLFFELAKPATGLGEGAGFVGIITANSFMKREFGRRLATEYLARQVDVTEIVDTSGAYIPGHGTPTVILIGRHRVPAAATVRVAVSSRSEPEHPSDPGKGKVWQALTEEIDRPGAVSDWANVRDMARTQLTAWPWVLSDGTVQSALTRLSALPRLGKHGVKFSNSAMSGADDAFLAPCGVFARYAPGERAQVRPMITGDGVRDWMSEIETEAVVPAVDGFDSEDTPGLYRRLWPLRTLLRSRKVSGTTAYLEGRRRWYEWNYLPPSADAPGRALVLAAIATHLNVAPRPEHALTGRSAPALAFPDSAQGHVRRRFAALLNSSTAAFWVRSHAPSKGQYFAGGSPRAVEPWEEALAFTAANVSDLPIPSSTLQDTPLPIDPWIERITEAASMLATSVPGHVLRRFGPDPARLDEACLREASLREDLIAFQEELDWAAYRSYGLLSAAEADQVCADPALLPPVRLGERAFEIVMARRMAAGRLRTQWFTRHGSTPITEFPAHWPAEYRRVAEQRIEVIERHQDISLMERPECKRRWASEPWSKRERQALRSWLLEHCEDRNLWFTHDEDGRAVPRTRTVESLAASLEHDGAVLTAAARFAGTDAPLVDVLGELVETEHVPCLAASRYKESGLRVHAAWERCWDQQREEDRTGSKLDIPTPPQYRSSDFVRPSYWANRGKLDVPKERFISYLEASRAPRGRHLVLGWAGWDYRERAHALVLLIEEAADGGAGDPLTPLLAALAEVLPWVHQWHGEIDPDYGISPAEQYATYLTEQTLRQNLTLDQLRAWRPEPPKRGRPRKVVDNER